MSTPPLVFVHPDEQSLAQAAAARLAGVITHSQAARNRASIVLTGGGMGAAILAALRSGPAHDVIDWSRLDLWWGDERFLPTGDPERNETQARAALLDAVPLDPARVHPIAGPDRARDVDDAAAQYAAQLREAAALDGPHRTLPVFDVVLLGMGPDAHVASLFPEHPAVHESQASVIGVRGAPKPPPERVSLTLPALGSGDAVWFLVAGAAKARAVGLALSGAGPWQVPAAAVAGQSSTLWLLDQAAAAHVPPELVRPGRG